MSQQEFLQKLEEHVQALNEARKEIDSQISSIKSLIVGYEFEHRND